MPTPSPVPVAGQLILASWGAAVTSELAAMPSRYAPITLGKVAYAARVTVQTGIGQTATDVTGLSVTWSGLVGHLYKTTVQVEMTATAGDGAFIIAVTDPADAQLKRATDACLTTSGRTITLVLAETGGTGTYTRKVRAQKAGGTGTISIGGAAAYPAFILVEDIGLA